MFPTTEERTLHMNITRINTKIRLIDYILCSLKTEKLLYSQQKQDQELIEAEIMNSLLPNPDLNWRKVRKTTRPFRYDLNQIPYDYTVELTNRLKGLDLTECLKIYGIRFINTVQKAVIKIISKKKKCTKKIKRQTVIWGGWEKKRSERHMRKGKIYPSEYRVTKKTKEK